MADPWVVTLTLIGATVGLVYLFLTWNFGYWRKRGVREVKSYPLFGSFPSAFTKKRNMIYDIVDISRKYKNEHNFVGIFTTRAPQLLILKPEYVHRVYVTDFKSFHDNEMSEFVNEKNDLLFSNNPFTLKGEQWKERRIEIVPGMSPNRVKSVYPVSLEVCKRLSAYLKQQTKMAGKDGIDFMDCCYRYTAEVVSDCILGIKADSFTDQPAPILHMSKKFLDQLNSFMGYQIVVGLLPIMKYFYKMRIFTKEMEQFFINLMQQSIELRRRQKTDRVDFLNFLLQLQDKKGWSTEILTSHVMTYMTDGFLTTALAVSNCLLLLSRDSSRQERVRAEILANLEDDGSLSFESLMELPFLDACFHETLRLYPAALTMNKVCTEPCELADKDGTVLKLNKGDVIMIPHYCLHYDENIYENPQSFQPERFLAENGGVKKYRDQGAYLGFGDGPRACLGMRFALVQSKSAIVEVIRNFRVTSNPKTRSDNLIDKVCVPGCLDGGVWLDLEPIE